MILTVAVVFKVPIRLGFALIRPALERVLEGRTAASFEGLQADIPAPLYRVSAEATNQRMKRDRERGVNTNRVLFVVAGDSEAAFIYSPGGVDDLAFNSGSVGRLAGNWYWMKED